MLALSHAENLAGLGALRPLCEGSTIQAPSSQEEAEAVKSGWAGQAGVTVMTRKGQLSREPNQALVQFSLFCFKDKLYFLITEEKQNSSLPC